jgi:micrococcal nuclease
MKTSLFLKISLVSAILIAFASPAVIAQDNQSPSPSVSVRKLKDVIVEGIAECKTAAPVGDRAALRSCLKTKIIAFLKEQSQQKRTAGKAAGSPSPVPAADFAAVKVLRVVDGDTIEIEGGQRVRYIGIDTPETVDPRKPVQCFGKEAAAKNRVLVEGQEVRLEKDISDTDRYGRLLRYVYVGDTLINELLVSEGYAHASSYPPDVKYQEKLRAAEEEARAEERGLWGNCAASTPAPSSSSTAGAAGACQYSCLSPDRDCSNFSDPTAAQDFFDCCGFTATNDPMKLDSLGIGDGVACGSASIKPTPTGTPSPTATPKPKSTPIILPEEEKPSYERSSETSSSSDCDISVTCGSLSSCGEARYYLNTCGQTRLDGDGNGTPCESLCK